MRGVDRVRPAPPAVLALAAILLLASAARAQPDGRLGAVLRGGVLYLSLDDLARALGTRLTVAGDSVALRAREGILTLFEGSPDGLWQAAGAAEAGDVAARAPVLREGGRWYVPVDLLAAIGLELEGDVLRLPDGRGLAVARPADPPPAGERYEVLELAAGVPALRLYAPGEAGPRTVSALLVDLALLPLAVPEGRRELDALAAELGDERALYLVVTALAPSAWEAAFRFTQGDREVVARAPFRLRLLEGEAGRVGPGRPVAALILLPRSIDLRSPLRVAWGDLEVELAFRR